jgi:hypothetical protein
VVAVGDTDHSPHPTCMLLTTTPNHIYLVSPLRDVHRARCTQQGTKMLRQPVKDSGLLHSISNSCTSAGTKILMMETSERERIRIPRWR